MKPQIIERDGEPEYVVIPYQEYLRLVQDAELLADAGDFDAVNQRLLVDTEELIPAEVVDRLLDGENPVRVWREFRRMSAAELAKACGVTAVAISQIESGKGACSMAVLERISSHLRGRTV